MGTYYTTSRPEFYYIKHANGAPIFRVRTKSIDRRPCLTSRVFLVAICQLKSDAWGSPDAGQLGRWPDTSLQATGSKRTEYD